jgi:hypothetical protein
MPPIKLQVHTITRYWDEWANTYDGDMPTVEIDEENAVILSYRPSEREPVTNHIMATTISEDDEKIKIFTVEGQSNKGWRKDLIYWDTTNKLLKFAAPDDNPNGLVEYIEYQYE